LHENGFLCTEADENVLAGSSFTMIQCMNYLANLGIFNSKKLLQVGYFNQLDLLQVDPDKLPDCGVRIGEKTDQQKFYIV